MKLRQNCTIFYIPYDEILKLLTHILRAIKKIEFKYIIHLLFKPEYCTFRRMTMHFIVFINVFILSTSEEKINSFVVSLLGRAQQSGTLNYYDRLRNNCRVLNGYTIT